MSSRTYSQPIGCDVGTW